MNNLEALKSISNYPVPQRTLDRVAAGRGLVLEADATIISLKLANYRLAAADVMMWIANAPNIVEDGIGFNMLVTDREAMRNQAQASYDELEAPVIVEEIKVSRFGYKGENL